MKRKNIILISSSLFLITFASLSIQSLMALNALSDQNYLEQKILDNTNFASDSYSYKKFTSDEVNNFVLAHKNEIMQDPSKEKFVSDITALNKHMNEYRDYLSKQMIKVNYFYMNKNSIEYFISFKETPTEPYCRLAVRSNTLINKTLNKLGLLQSKNHAEHSIKKSICNGLYGYGKPKY
jgi:Trm5-related predicted tRNA methylase